MTTLYAVHNGHGWLTKQGGIEFDLEPWCLFRQPPTWATGEIHQFELVQRYVWPNVRKDYTPQLELIA